MADRKVPKLPKYLALRANYKRLYRNMVEHGVPKDVALVKSTQLQEKQNAYNKSPRKANGSHVQSARNAFADWFYDDFYDDLEQNYGYDIFEDYPEEE